jgi:hypothetical protein
MQGTAPEKLTASNCANPRFTGSLGPAAASPKDPLAGVAPGSLGNSAAAGSGGSGAQTGGAATGGAAAAGSGSKQGLAQAAAASSSPFRQPAPAAYDGPDVPSPSATPIAVLALVAAVPLLVVGPRRLLAGVRTRLPSVRRASR